MKNNKKAEKLFDAISEIDQADIENFAQYDDKQPEAETVRKDRPVIKIIGVAAACLVLFGGISAGLKLMELKMNSNGPAAASENTGDTEEETEELLVKRHVYKIEEPYAKLEKGELAPEEQEIADRYYNEMVEKFPEFAKIPRDRIFEYVFTNEDDLDVEFGFCLGDIGTNYWCSYHDYDYAIEEYNDFLNGWKITGDRKFDEIYDLQLPQLVNDDIISLLKKNARAYAEENGLEIARFVDKDPDDILERVCFYYDENGLYVVSITIAEPKDATMPTPHIYAYVGVEINDDTITLVEYPASAERLFTSEDEDYEYTFTPNARTGDMHPPYAKPEKSEFTAEQNELVDRVYNEMLGKYPDLGKIDREMLREDVFYADNNTSVTFTFCIGGIPTPYQCTYTENVGGYKDWQIHGEEFKEFYNMKLPELSVIDLTSMLAKHTQRIMKAEKLDMDNFDKNKMIITWSVDENGQLFANSEYIAAVTDKTEKQYEGGYAHVYDKVSVTIEDNNDLTLREYPASVK